MRGLQLNRRRGAKRVSDERRLQAEPLEERRVLASTFLTDMEPFWDGFEYQFEFSPDGNYVVLISDLDPSTGTERTLFSIDLNTADVVMLNKPLTNGRDVYNFEIAADSRHVVYRSNEDGDLGTEVFSVPIGGGTPTQLNPFLIFNREVREFQITPDGRNVVYLSDHDAILNDVFDLFVVPIEGGTVERITDSGSYEGGGNLDQDLYSSIEINSTGTHVVTTGDIVTGHTLFSFPLDGSGVIPLADVTLQSSREFRIAPSGDIVVFETDAGNDLYSVPIAGGSATQLASGVRDYRLSESRVVFWTPSNNSANRSRGNEIFSVPLSGGEVKTLNPPKSPNEDIVAAVISPGDDQVLFSLERPDGTSDLFLAAIGGSGTRQLTNSDYSGALVRGFGFSPDGNYVVYRGPQQTYQYDLYSIPVAGGEPIRLNPPLTPFGNVGSLFYGSFSVTWDSKHVVYIADQDVDNRGEMYRVPIEGGEAVKLNAQTGFTTAFPLVYNSPHVSPANDRVIYLADEEVDGEFNFYVTPLADPVINIEGTSGSVDIRRNGDEIEVVDVGTNDLLFRQPLDGTHSVTLTGDVDQAYLSVDYLTGGFFELPGGITLEGGASEQFGYVFGASDAIVSSETALFGDIQVETRQGNQSTTVRFRDIESISATQMLTASFEGELHVGDGDLSIGALSYVDMGPITTLAGGSLSILGGMHLEASELLRGYGGFGGPIRSEPGSVIDITGDSSLGDFMSFDGNDIRGRLNINNHTLTLRDGHKSVLGSQTTLGNFAGDGTLDARYGVVIPEFSTLVGRGTVDTSQGEFENQGFVQCNGGGITFNDPVTGAGDYGGSCTFLGGSNFGNSPAEIAAGSITFGPENEHTVELGGLVAGSEYDRVQATGEVRLDGTLEVRFLELDNGYSPAAGDSFTIVSAAGGVTGAFATELLPALPDGLQWEIKYNATDVTLLISTAGSVVNRRVFYNNSSFDSASDDDAIAAATALHPGETSSFANYTSYVHGINGLMIDLAGANNPSSIDSSDFVFRVGVTDEPATWQLVSIQPQVEVRSGEGDSGSDRFVLTWPNGTITNTWLEVTVKATSATGLINDDVFYFGNQVGDSNGDGAVDAIDYQTVRSNPANFTNPAPLESPHDMNRDGMVNAIDLLIVRDFAAGIASRLPQITPSPTLTKRAGFLTLDETSDSKPIATIESKSLETAIFGGGGEERLAALLATMAEDDDFALVAETNPPEPDDELIVTALTAAIE